MYRKAAGVPKGELGKDGWYTLFNTTETLKPGKGSFQFFSVDPAKNNLAIRAERRSTVSGRIETLAWEKVNLSSQEDPPQSDFTFWRLSSFLDRYEDIIKTSDAIIFERQLHINYMSLRISQHLLTYFLTKFPHILLAEVSPKLKSYMLEAPKGMNKNQLKAWSVTKTYDLLEIRGDTIGKEILALYKKKKHKLDDLADSLVQIEALCKLWELPLSVIPLKINIVTVS